VIMAITRRRIVASAIISMVISMLIGAHHVMLVRMVLGARERGTDGAER
jgi:hypothetical protein